VNIFITIFPTVKLTDFGLSGHVLDRKSSKCCGSASRAAQESLGMIRSDRELSDQWRLGVILDELLVGAFPWTDLWGSAMILDRRLKMFSHKGNPLSTLQFSHESPLVRPALEDHSLTESILMLRN
jgi:serine/threonine protein kinase